MTYVPMIHCEGSGCKVHNSVELHPSVSRGICPMCGGAIQFDGQRLAVRHSRRDILRELDEGKFDG